SSSPHSPLPLVSIPSPSTTLFRSTIRFQSQGCAADPGPSGRMGFHSFFGMVVSGYAGSRTRYGNRAEGSLRNPFLQPAGQAQERSEEHTSELQSRENLVCRLLLEK